MPPAGSERGWGGGLLPALGTLPPTRREALPTSRQALPLRRERLRPGRKPADDDVPSTEGRPCGSPGAQPGSAPVEAEAPSSQWWHDVLGA